MKTYMLIYAYVPDMLERRQPHREAHLQHLRDALDRGMLSLGAAFSDPVAGALLLVAAETPGDVYAWVANDPYNRDGLLRGVTVREIAVAVRR